VSVTLTYEEGTIRLAGDVPEDLPGVERDDRSKTARAPAYRYAAIRDALAECGVPVDDGALDLPPLTLESSYELREYQRTALDAWRGADERGVLELPTGSGKTVIGIAAMEALGTPTLVVVPTIDLLEQWQRELETEFDRPIGRLGGGEQRVEDVTVSTYDSAYLRADELGDRFGFVVFDEVHHLGGEGYRDVARLLAAPARLGLTATFERPDDAHEVIADLIGPVVHRLSVDDLAGDHLAEYDVKRVEVSLTDAEREVYEDHQSTFTDYLARSGIRMRSGSDYQELVKRSGSDPAAREALLAKQRAREVMMNADRKVEELADILDRHSHDRIIVFTAHTDLVYRLSERFLLPAITHETSAAERREILERFREGSYSRVVTANVLDEGVDVPDANVAVVLSGSGSEREFTQRLGRILRPKEDGVSESGDSKARGTTASSLGGRALLYELVSEETAEENVAARRR
jgi:superfamily II DNA or RNA helicase